MGELVNITKASLSIPASRFEEVLTRLKAASTPFFEFASKSEISSARSVTELFEATAFRLVLDERGNVCAIQYISDKLPKDTDFEQLRKFFDVFAPCVDKGGVVRVNSHGHLFTFRFTGKRCELTSREIKQRRSKKPADEARRLRSEGKIDEGFALLDRAIATARPAERVRLVESKALSLESEKRFEQAADEYGVLAILDPSSEIAEHRRGLCLEKLGRLDEAEEAARRGNPWSLGQFFERHPTRKPSS